MTKFSALDVSGLLFLGLASSAMAASKPDDSSKTISHTMTKTMTHTIFKGGATSANHKKLAKEVAAHKKAMAKKVAAKKIVTKTASEAMAASAALRKS